MATVTIVQEYYKMQEQDEMRIPLNLKLMQEMSSEKMLNLKVKTVFTVDDKLFNRYALLVHINTYIMSK